MKVVGQMPSLLAAAELNRYTAFSYLLGRYFKVVCGY
jgi:hypothetical protein